MRRAAFFGTSLPAARRGSVAVARAPQLTVRAGQQISADVEKPIGLTFKESKAKGGGLVVTVRLGLQAVQLCPAEKGLLKGPHHSAVPGETPAPQRSPARRGWLRPRGPLECTECWMQQMKVDGELIPAQRPRAAAW